MDVEFSGDLYDFIRAALSCPESYAGGGKANPLADRPGWKGYEVTNTARGFRLIDQYWNHYTGSGGMICVWCRERIVMYMAYHGGYAREATPFLREALLAGYKEPHFRGFRGPVIHHNADDTLRYSNIMSSGFCQPGLFRGREEIRSLTSDGRPEYCYGYHVYQGACFH